MFPLSDDPEILAGQLGVTERAGYVVQVARALIETAEVESSRIRRPPEQCVSVACYARLRTALVGEPRQLDGELL